MLQQTDVDRNSHSQPLLNIFGAMTLCNMNASKCLAITLSHYRKDNKQRDAEISDEPKNVFIPCTPTATTQQISQTHSSLH